MTARPHRCKIFGSGLRSRGLAPVIAGAIQTILARHSIVCIDAKKFSEESHHQALQWHAFCEGQSVGWDWDQIISVQIRVRMTEVMNQTFQILVAFLTLIPAFANPMAAQRIKVIVDQDARGPATTDMQSILIFLQSDKFDVLGITTVSGDQWVKDETPQRTLRLLEIAGRTDVSRSRRVRSFRCWRDSKEESERWEALYGKFEYKGCWSDFSKRPESTPPAFREGYHEPDEFLHWWEGSPHIKALDESAAHFIIRMVHKYPGEVVIWAGVRSADEHRSRAAAPIRKWQLAWQRICPDGQRNVCE